MRTTVLFGMALIMAGFCRAQVKPATSGAEVQKWETEEIEKQIRLTLDFEYHIMDQPAVGPEIYQIKINNSFPKPAYREQEEILRTYLAEYVTVLSRGYSIILGRKTEKSEVPEFQVDPTKSATLKTVVPLASRKITQVTRVQEKNNGYISTKKIEFSYDFLPNVPNLNRRNGLNGFVECQIDIAEQTLGVRSVRFEDQGLLEFKTGKP